MTLSGQSRPEREQILVELAQHLVARKLPHPLRVAIDGIDAAGKTTLADELAGQIEDLGRPVIHASIDGFHHPRAHRYRRGPLSPAGYYEDSFDYDALRANLLRPLGPAGDRRYRPAIFDHRADRPVEAPWQRASTESILLFDGVFLHRPELRGYWDTSIFLRVTFAEAIRRALQRDMTLFGSADVIEERYRRRYFPAQGHYLATCRPEEQATFVVDNENPECLGWTLTSEQK